MGRLSLAWQVLTNGSLAARVTELLRVPSAIPEKTPVVSKPAEQAKPVAPPRPTRSDAISLLATLQREGRLIDFLREPIDSYSDAQIGAAVRDIHRDCGAVLERQFAIRPVLEQPEGSQVSLAKSAGGRIRVTGRGAESAPSSGTLVHPGWQATRCDLPVWTGDAESALVLSPAEVEARSRRVKNFCRGTWQPLRSGDFPMAKFVARSQQLRTDHRTP